MDTWGSCREARNQRGRKPFFIKIVHLAQSDMLCCSLESTTSLSDHSGGKSFKMGSDAMPVTLSAAHEIVKNIVPLIL